MRKINSKYSPMISCYQAESFILDYIDHQLPFYTWLKFKFHLFICPKCRRYLRAYINSMNVVKSCMTSELHNQSQIAGDFSKELPKELKDIMVKIQQNK
jgi:hypothetical protein